MFVTFEGCEGVGKTTQLIKLKEYLEETGQKAIFVREPGSTSISEKIRQVILDPANTEMSPVTEALLYAAARAQHVKEVIKPALERGDLIICDRYIDSSIAYQGYARGIGDKIVKQINDPAMDGCIPDLTIFLDLPPKDSFRTEQIEDRMELESRDFHNKVYEGYCNEIATSNGRIVPIKPVNGIEKTFEMILQVMRERGIIK